MGKAAGMLLPGQLPLRVGGLDFLPTLDCNNTAQWTKGRNCYEMPAVLQSAKHSRLLQTMNTSILNYFVLENIVIFFYKVIFEIGL